VQYETMVLNGHPITQDLLDTLKYHDGSCKI
jgi:hypothetical protein